MIEPDWRQIDYWKMRTRRAEARKDELAFALADAVLALEEAGCEAAAEAAHEVVTRPVRLRAE